MNGTQNKEQLGIVYDQIGSPTYALDLAECIYKIAQTPNKQFGIYDYCNQGVTSWFDLTKEIQSICGIDCNILPIETYEYPLPAKRPAYSVLNTKKIQKNFDINIPYWKVSLEKCLKKLS